MRKNALIFMAWLFLASACASTQKRSASQDCRSQSETACSVDDPEYDYLNKIPELPPAPRAGPSDSTVSEPQGGGTEEPAVPTDLEPEPTPEPEPEPEPEPVPMLNWQCPQMSAYLGEQFWTCGSDGNAYRCTPSNEVEFKDCKGVGCNSNCLGCNDACADQPLPACDRSC